MTSGSYLSSAALSPVRRVTGPPGASLVPMSVSARGGPEKTTRGFAGAMRRTDRAVCRGTSLQSCDRTAGDSSPVTQERSAPGTLGADRRNLFRGGRNGCVGRGPSSTMQEQTALPDIRAAVTEARTPSLNPQVPQQNLAFHCLTAIGPRQARAPCAPGRRPTAHRWYANQRRNPPAPLPRHRRCPDAGADGEGPRGSVPRGPSLFATPLTSAS